MVGLTIAVTLKGFVVEAEYKPVSWAFMSKSAAEQFRDMYRKNLEKGDELERKDLRGRSERIEAKASKGGRIF